MDYTTIKVSFAILSIACVCLMMLGLRIGLRKANHATPNIVTAQSAIGIAVWIIVVAVLSLSGFLDDFSTIPPRFVILILPPIVFLVVLMRSTTFKNALCHIPITWLLYLQGFRVIVELLLWQCHELSLIPIQMSFEGSNLDILVGITGPIVAILYSKNLVGEKFLKLWNIAGLLLLANIVITAILSTPTIFRVFMNEPANTLVVVFPIVYLPAVLVPVAYYLHFFSLVQLRMLSKKGST